MMPIRSFSFTIALMMTAIILVLPGCKRVDSENQNRAETARIFPAAGRPVPSILGNQWSTEDARDKVGEAEKIMDAARIMPGMTVADIGAGNGYYTVRLADRVGESGRVLAQDIDQKAIDKLAERVARENLGNVSIKTGEPHDPRLPAQSFDRIFLVHMYHEVREPYAFLWNLRPALNKTGEIIVVDVNQPVEQHGMPPKQLFCEFETSGFQLIGFSEQPELGGYFARFKAIGEAPTPAELKSCGDVTQAQNTPQSPAVNRQK